MLVRDGEIQDVAPSDTEEFKENQRFHPRAQRVRAKFWRNNTQTTEQIIDTVRKVSKKQKSKRRRDPKIKAKLKDQVQQQQAATKKVNKPILLLQEETCGKVDL